MKILSIDTSTQCASCALIDGSRLLGEINFNYKKQHSVLMMDMIQNLLSTCGTKISQVDGFVVSKGPGSFTGLRIGLATIKGMVHGTQKPFASVSTLDALALNLSSTSGVICSIIDALRDHVYYGLYTFEPNGELKVIHDIDRLPLDELLEKASGLNSEVTFVGDCLEKFQERILSYNGSFKTASYNNSIVRASSLAYLGAEKIEKGEVDDIFASTPIYLIKSQAEREYEEKHGKSV